jgi:hypothetical protein
MVKGRNGERHVGAGGDEKFERLKGVAILEASGSSYTFLHTGRSDGKVLCGEMALPSSSG